MTIIYYYNCTRGDTTNSRMLSSNICVNKVYLISPYFTSPTQLQAYPLLSRSSIALSDVRDIVKTRYFRGPFLNPDRLFKMFPFKWKHWFLFSGMSELSKNIIIWLQLFTTFEQTFSLDIPTMTNCFYHSIGLCKYSTIHYLLTGHK